MRAPASPSSRSQVHIVLLPARVASCCPSFPVPPPVHHSHWALDPHDQLPGHCDSKHLRGHGTLVAGSSTYQESPTLSSQHIEPLKDYSSPRSMGLSVHVQLSFPQGASAHRCVSAGGSSVWTELSSGLRLLGGEGLRQSLWPTSTHMLFSSLLCTAQTVPFFAVGKHRHSGSFFSVATFPLHSACPAQRLVGSAPLVFSNEFSLNSSFYRWESQASES